jgi:hypothetical protein
LFRHVARLVAWLVVDYFASAARPGASARRAARCQLLRLRRASGCFGTSRGTSRGSSRRSSSTTSPRAGTSSSTSPTARVRVPRHVARLVKRHIIDYFTSRRLVVDYFAYAARPGASARHAARQVACRQLLHLRRAFDCFGSSRGLSRDSSSTTSPTPCVRVPRNVTRLVKRLVVNYFTYATCPVASARRAACHVTHRQLLRLAQARR